MRRRKGDVIINPWVSKELWGDLNPCYATMYIGNGKCIDYRGVKHEWCGLNDDHPEREYRTVGYIDINLKDMILKVLDDYECGLCDRTGKKGENG